VRRSPRRRGLTTRSVPDAAGPQREGEDRRDPGLQRAGTGARPPRWPGRGQVRLRHFTTLVARHGLPPIRLHDLRHTSASIGLAGGESLLEVSRRLGHSSIAITADTYSHISPATASESAQRLAQLIDDAI
jgi:integrase